MAKSNPQRSLRIELAARYDRYAEEKLAQVYRVLVPGLRHADNLNNGEPNHEEECGHLCTSILGSAEATKHDCQSDGAAVRICPKP